MKKKQKRRSFLHFIAIIATGMLLTGLKVQARIPMAKTTIINGAIETDINGNTLNAHGGGFLKVGKYYYLIGENRQKNVLVSCYRSTDLINWEFRGDLITRSSNHELANANIERPKVIYNDSTKKFVMWMHYETRSNYGLARAAVATSDNIEKPFTYINSFRPLDNMSRDCNLYKDADNKAYFISSTRENRDMNLYELTNDYLGIKIKVGTFWTDAQREAPAIMKRGNYYFILTSFCTGWEPNQAKYSYSKSLWGPWSKLKNVGSPTTYNTQPTFILPIQGKKTTNYLYVGDRWDPSQYSNSRSVYLPLTFLNDTTMKMDWVKKITPDLVSGEVLTRNEPQTQIRIKSKWSSQYLSIQQNQDSTSYIAEYKLGYSQPNLRWEIFTYDKGLIKIKNVQNGKYIEEIGNNKTKLSKENNSDTQLWKEIRQKDGWIKLVNKATGKALTIERPKNKKDELLYTTDYNDKYDANYDKQGFLLAPVYE
jgi:hypothetical protein